MMHFDKFLTAPQVEDSEDFAAFEAWYGVPLEEYCEEIRKEDRKAREMTEKRRKRYEIDDFLD